MSQDTSNPYALSASSSLSGTVPANNVDFLPIMKSWEVFRLWYNGTLALYVLLWTAYLQPGILLDLLYWFHLCTLGVLANILFCLGPTVEGYGRCLGIWTPFFRSLLFFAGLGLTVLLATLFVLVRLR